MDERIKNIKIAVHNEEESKVVQEKLRELGAFTNIPLEYDYIFVHKDGISKWVEEDKKYFDEHFFKEIYVEDLLAMQVKKEESLVDKCVILDHFSRPYGDYCKREDILEAKKKILEEAQKEFLANHDFKNLIKILDKWIGKEK